MRQFGEKHSLFHKEIVSVILWYGNRCNHCTRNKLHSLSELRFNFRSKSPIFNMLLQIQLLLHEYIQSWIQWNPQLLPFTKLFSYIPSTEQYIKRTLQKREQTLTGNNLSIIKQTIETWLILSQNGLFYRISSNSSFFP